MIDCKDKHIVIIGATGGIGKVLCKKLMNEGAKLSISGRNQEKLNELTEDIKVFSKSLDIRKEEEVALFLEEAYKINGEIYAIKAKYFFSSSQKLGDEEKIIFRETACSGQFSLFSGKT